MPRQKSASEWKHSQAGIVLIMALIMLVVISLLAGISVRNATSSEGVNANVRQAQLASQAAETALRYCEDAVITMAAGGTPTASFSSPPGSTPFAFSATYVRDYTTTTPISMSTTVWDSTASSYPNSILVLPISSVNRVGITSTFSRPPECMVERLSPSTASTYTKNFNITARGFGPEVGAADGSRTRPIGSEVWMQSSLELN
jgi:type IV pilus assembly protein PilX